MSLEGLLKELEKKKALEKQRQLESVMEKHAAELREKDLKISALMDELETMRCWLDHSALPAFNPISKRKDSMGLVKLNFNDDKPCPEMWLPGEKELLDSVKKEPIVEEDQVPIPPAPERAPPEEALLLERSLSAELPPELDRPNPPAPDLSERPDAPTPSLDANETIPIIELDEEPPKADEAKATKKTKPSKAKSHKAKPKK